MCGVTPSVRILNIKAGGFRGRAFGSERKIMGEECAKAIIKVSVKVSSEVRMESALKLRLERKDRDGCEREGQCTSIRDISCCHRRGENNGR